MLRYSLKSTLTKEEQYKWRQFLESQPTAHPFQDVASGEIWSKTGRQPLYLWGSDDGALKIVASLSRREIPLTRRSTFIIPRGPVFSDIGVFIKGLEALIGLLKSQGAISCKVNPYWKFPGGEKVEEVLQEAGFRPSNEESFHSSTLQIDLQPSLEDIFSTFRQTTRHEIVKFQKMGGEIHFGQKDEDFQAFYDIHKAMCKGKGLPPLYFRSLRALWETWLQDRSGGALVLASYHGKPVAGAIILKFKKQAWYTWGASIRKFPKLPLGHSLQWQAMQWAKSVGCEIYDLGGWISLDELSPNDPKRGASIFKGGFSKKRVDFVREHDLVLSPRLHWLFLKARAWRNEVRRRIL